MSIREVGIFGNALDKAYFTLEAENDLLEKIEAARKLLREQDNTELFLICSRQYRDYIGKLKMENDLQDISFVDTFPSELVTDSILMGTRTAAAYIDSPKLNPKHLLKIIVNNRVT